MGKSNCKLLIYETFNLLINTNSINLFQNSLVKICVNSWLTAPGFDIHNSDQTLPI